MIEKIFEITYPDLIAFQIACATDNLKLHYGYSDSFKMALPMSIELSNPNIIFYEKGKLKRLVRKEFNSELNFIDFANEEKFGGIYSNDIAVIDDSYIIQLVRRQEFTKDELSEYVKLMDEGFDVPDPKYLYFNFCVKTKDLDIFLHEICPFIWVKGKH